MHGPIGFVGAVHAEHTEPLFIGSGECAKAHQRRGDGKFGESCKLAQKLACTRTRIDDTAAGIEDRLPGAFH